MRFGFPAFREAYRAFMTFLVLLVTGDYGCFEPESVCIGCVVSDELFLQSLQASCDLGIYFDFSFVT